MDREGNEFHLGNDEEVHHGMVNSASKPQQKTPFQKGALEQAFAINQYPSDDVRRELGERLGLKPSQVQVWFTHRRAKAKRDEVAAVVRKNMEEKEKAGSGLEDKPMMQVARAKLGSHASGMSFKSEKPTPPQPNDDSESEATEEETEDEETEDEDPEVLAAREKEEVIEMAKSLLDVEIHPNGPAMGFEFDSPPGPAVKGNNKRKRVVTKDGEGVVMDDGTFVKSSKKSKSNKVSESKKKAQEEERMRQKQMQEEARKERLRQEQEKRAKKEAERALLLQQRLEQAMKKEAERVERERRKEQERIEREAAKEELRIQKEKERQRAAMERERQKEEMARELQRKKEAAARERERQREEAARERERVKEEQRIEKERRAEERRIEMEKRRAEQQAEKERRAEERRLEREMQNALRAQERAALKAKQREMGIGQVEDDELEWELLMKSRHDEGYGSDTEGPNCQGAKPILRPPFPPPELVLRDAFSDSLKEVGPDVLMVWAFCTSFPELLGLWPCCVEDLLLALVEGSGSRLLAEIHISLIKLALADMEESHAKGVLQQALNFVDRAVYNAAHHLEEAWAWGFETDVWRAHLNAATWPEVLRQLAIALGHGRRRPYLKDGVAKTVGEEGEDVLELGEGGLKLKVPARFCPGSIKAAAWTVLSRVGPAGMSVTEITACIQAEGLHELQSSRPPEAMVAGALMRDAVFYRLSPGVYGLHAVVVVAHQLEDPQSLVVEVLPRDEVAEQSVPDESEEEEERYNEVAGSHSWILTLEQSDYNSLSLSERVSVLVMLVDLVNEGPTVRARLEARMTEGSKVRKQVQDDNKVEKQRKQAEAAAKAAEVAREAMKALDKSKVEEIAGEGEGDSSQSGKDAFAEAAKKAMEEAEGRIKAAEGTQDAATVAEEEECRRRERYEALRRAEEATAIRFRPLGTDRRENRYWRLVRPDNEGQSDPGQGRIFFEDHISGELALLGDEEALRVLTSSLMERGLREGALLKAIRRSEKTILEHMPSKRLELPSSSKEGVAEQQSAWCLTQSTSASVAGQSQIAPRDLTGATMLTGDTPPEDMPLMKLKQDMLEVEMALPREAVLGLERDAWRDGVGMAVSAEQLRSSLGELETAISPSFISPDYRLKPHLVKGAWVLCGKEVLKIPGPNEEPQYVADYVDELPEPLQWLPPTVASVALRLQALDSALIYCRGIPPARDEVAAYRYIQRPTPPIMQGVSALFHLQGHRYGDREYVRTLFCGELQPPPRLLPPFPHWLLADGPPGFELPVEALLAARVEAEGPKQRVGVTGRGRGRGGRGRGTAFVKPDRVEAADESAEEEVGWKTGRRTLRGRPSFRGGRGRVGVTTGRRSSFSRASADTSPSSSHPYGASSMDGDAEEDEPGSPDVSEAEDSDLDAGAVEQNSEPDDDSESPEISDMEDSD